MDQLVQEFYDKDILMIIGNYLARSEEGRNIIKKYFPSKIAQFLTRDLKAFYFVVDDEVDVNGDYLSIEKRGEYSRNVTFQS